MTYAEDLAVDVDELVVEDLAVVGDASFADGVATPYESVDDAIAVVLDRLEDEGCGRWTFGNVSLQELDEEIDALVPIAAPPSTRLLALRPVDPAASSAGPRVREIVFDAARLVATLMAVEEQRARLVERLESAERESTVDSLTGLPNARAWWRLLSREGARCDRQGVPAVVLVIDLDELKATNDTAGHLAGDMLLRRAGARLTECLRESDMVARVGGDEFAALATNAGPDAVAVLVDHVQSALAAAGVAASVGGAVYEPGGRINDTFHLADQAMYATKRRRRLAS